MESVTIVLPGFCSRTIAEDKAINLFLFISSPFLSTHDALSTSVSNIIPKSALLLRTALFRNPIAVSSSGLGT